MIKMTEREKYIAAMCGTRDWFLQNIISPLIFESNEQITKIKEKAKSKSWFMTEYVGMYVAFSPEGHRKYFEYFMFDSQTKKETERWKKLASKASKLWAKGDKTGAKKVMATIEKECHRFNYGN